MLTQHLERDFGTITNPSRVTYPDKKSGRKIISISI